MHYVEYIHEMHGMKQKILLMKNALMMPLKTKHKKKFIKHLKNTLITYLMFPLKIKHMKNVMFRPKNFEFFLSL
jgi:hypothetical protein